MTRPLWWRGERGEWYVGFALGVLVFFDIKSRLEERWLAEKFPGYPACRERVKKLIPWVYRAPEGQPYSVSRQPTGTCALGHTSSRKHAPHAGRFAVQIWRPWLMRS